MANRYLYLSREDYEAMKARGAVACEEIVDEPSGETRFKILVRRGKRNECMWSAVLRDPAGAPHEKP